MRCEACLQGGAEMIFACRIETCIKGAMQEAWCPAYNVRSSCCAFVDEARLWHTDCAGTSF